MAAALLRELNRNGLIHEHRKETRRLFGLTVPGMIVLVIALVLPLGVMTYLSFIGEDGTFSFENYTRIWESDIYGRIFGVTFLVAVLTTAIVVFIGYPLAYLLSQLPAKIAGIAMLGVLMPLWTPVLVRTYAWLALLQGQGIINNTLIHLGAISQPLPLANNLTGTLIGMVQVMLPFLILPLYGSMKAVDPNLMCAASNLGARPSRAFWDVFFPLSLPGLLSGALMVFVLCLGFYVTPAVLGGGRVIMVAMRIDANVRIYSSWGAASALGVVLIVVTAVLLLVAYWMKNNLGRSR
ncbi:ABC transporter permease (plasmid) [Agrobacterium radiobacter]|uniref:ABC transporter permease n=2 Tax=Agrobacterium tumefaciens TaxID=358 RepID=Q44382_AGRTU|nr:MULTISPECIES: ABC transporter permease [Rhizobium/Agrobacterium group]AHK05202.1 mannopine permease [Agrobacterium tumefaciens LBA4213 (Ach5)]AKC10932.1 spermidine/putrescine transport system permease protein [Agrobacterium tumefaciens]AAC18649.1 motC [Agrobacterium tumefaciens]ASK41551.1 ABC transporter permease [Agrobacterium tumefaciens]ASK47154.1 ABC transporter permease [Agrobacterium radiobacter]